MYCNTRLQVLWLFFLLWGALPKMDVMGLVAFTNVAQREIPGAVNESRAIKIKPERHM